jgi:hypothetical protein
MFVSKFRFLSIGVLTLFRFEAGVHVGTLAVS